MKRFIIICHARKNVKGEGNVDLINEKALEEIEKNGIPGLNGMIKDQTLILHMGSAFECTQQTIFALLHYMERCGDSYRLDGWLPADNRFGNEKLFAKFMADEKIVTEAKTSNWFGAFKKYNDTFMIEVQAELFNAIRETFASVPDGRTIVMVNHTPLIEWLAFRFDRHEHIHISRDLQLSELTGFVFTEDQRQITITGTVGFELQKTKAVFKS